MIKIIILVLSILNYTLSHDLLYLQNIRGGLVPQASEVGGDYYEQFDLDYGNNDKVRIAGSLRGFIRTGNLAALPESDPFLKWINEHLEKGPEPFTNRVKPFYAADFGSREDLKPKENPKIIIVNRKLKSDSNGNILEGSKDIDVEIREIWQPWLKYKCDFVVRYIVPDRVNIIKILESKKLFRGELAISNDENGNQKVQERLIFNPTILQRLTGKRTVVMTRDINPTVLEGSKKQEKGNVIEFTKSKLFDTVKSIPIVNDFISKIKKSN